MNARWYDPSTARFIQPDSIVPEPGNPQALNSDQQSAFSRQGLVNQPRKSVED
jgi:hypothetical protein